MPTPSQRMRPLVRHRQLVVPHHVAIMQHELDKRVNLDMYFNQGKQTRAKRTRVAPNGARGGASVSGLRRSIDCRDLSFSQRKPGSATCSAAAGPPYSGPARSGFVPSSYKWSHRQGWAPTTLETLQGGPPKGPRRTHSFRPSSANWADPLDADDRLPAPFPPNDPSLEALERERDRLMTRLVFTLRGPLIEFSTKI